MQPVEIGSSCPRTLLEPLPAASEWQDGQVSERTRLSIWGVLSGSDREVLRAWIERIAKWHDAPVFEPHVTLVGSAPDFDDTAAAIDRAVVSLRRPPIDLLELVDTDDFFRCLVLTVGRTRQFDLLRSSLVTDVASQEPYWPHLSLLYASLGPAERATLRQRVTIELPLRSAISGVWLVDTSSPHVSDWTPMRSWSLALAT